MDLLELIIEFHKDNERQGPGSDEATLKALSYIPLMNEKTKILDIGCGTGGQTLILANNTAAQITAVDMLPQFLETLMKKAKENNLLDRITAKEMLMDNLTFDKDSFDVIWSEGAIYNIGFEKGLSLWTKYLKDNGFIAVSEISWLTDTRPEEIQQYWVNTYQEIDTIENKLSVNDRKSYNHCQGRNQKIAQNREKTPVLSQYIPTCSGKTLSKYKKLTQYRYSQIQKHRPHPLISKS